MFRVIEVTLFGNVVIYEFTIIIMVTVISVMRTEIYWMLTIMLGINKHYDFCFTDERTEALKDRVVSPGWSHTQAYPIPEPERALNRSLQNDFLRVTLFSLLVHLCNGHKSSFQRAETPQIIYPTKSDYSETPTAITIYSSSISKYFRSRRISAILSLY